MEQIGSIKCGSIDLTCEDCGCSITAASMVCLSSGLRPGSCSPVSCRSLALLQRGTELRTWPMVTRQLARADCCRLGPAARTVATLKVVLCLAGGGGGGGPYSTQQRSPPPHSHTFTLHTAHHTTTTTSTTTRTLASADRIGGIQFDFIVKVKMCVNLEMTSRAVGGGRHQLTYGGPILLTAPWPAASSPALHPG